MFEPDLTLYWRGEKGDLPEGWYTSHSPDALRKLWQLQAAIGVKVSPRLADADYEAAATAAGRLGWCVETIQETS